MNNGEFKQWFAVDVITVPDAIEAVEHAFNMLGSLGTEVSDLRRSKTGDACVAGYFDDRPADADVATALASALEIYGLGRGSVTSVDTRLVPETDWLAEWKKHWTPTEIGPFLIAPPWSEIGSTGKIAVRIEPNMAFGTGTHETTQLCLAAIGQHLVEGLSFLDVGTGTGILAIGAAKLARTSVITACDTDPDSIHIARENAAANGVEKRIRFFEGSISSETRHHDLVCANLTLDVIVGILPALLAISDRALLLSGILTEQQAEITSELAKYNLSEFNVERAREWISVLISKH